MTLKDYKRQVKYFIILALQNDKTNTLNFYIKEVAKAQTVEELKQVKSLFKQYMNETKETYIKELTRLINLLEDTPSNKIKLLNKCLNTFFNYLYEDDGTYSNAFKKALEPLKIYLDNGLMVAILEDFCDCYKLKKLELLQKSGNMEECITWYNKQGIQKYLNEL